MSRNRTTPEKVTDWSGAFNVIRSEITPPALSKMLAGFNEVMAAATTPAEAVELLQQSMALARLISANDRAAALAAAILTSSGGGRPVVMEDPE